MLIEGSFLFLVGGLIGTYSSISVSKFKEIVFHSESWTFEKWEKNLKLTSIVLCTGIFLFSEAIIFSLAFNI
jgi:hypothetical protein